MRQLLVGLVLVGVLVPSAATAGEAEDRAVRISQNVMSPFCPGSTLHDCPSDEAIALRAEIEEWVRNGVTTATIYNRLEREYGPGIRAVPRDAGSILVWVVPALVLLAGGALAYVVARRWRSDTTRENVIRGLASPSADDKKRLEAELHSLNRDRFWWRR